MNQTVIPQDQQAIIQVAINVPLRRVFDYLLPDHLSTETVQPGSRVKVPFGRQEKVGLVIGQENNTDLDQTKLKTITELIDPTPLFSDQLLSLMKWASAYYHHPLGEVVSAAIPAELRKGTDAAPPQIECWRVIKNFEQSQCDQKLARAPKQREFFDWLRQQTDQISSADCQLFSPKWRDLANKCREKGLVEPYLVDQLPSISHGNQPAHDLNPEQAEAVEKISGNLDQFEATLLDGVTGSGKTEVYFQLMQKVLDADQQVLVLIPEIALTMQLIERFRQRFSVPIALMHSGLSDSERLRSWHDARQGNAKVIIGTRSAVWTPLPKLGLIIIDEEHDASFKQQEGFRYSARDVATVRAQRADIPIILGSATPSLESLFNVEQKRYSHSQLKKRAGNASPPPIRFVDLRSVKLDEGLSPQLLDQIKTRLSLGQQSLLFLNRRGFSPVVMCHDCGWIAQCRHCDAKMTYHQQHRVMRCHHCGAQQQMVSQCGECESLDLISVGQGTERITQRLETLFPDARILRIDRDTTRSKDTLTEMLARIDRGEVDILVGTQMLSKGHHFPNVTLVGILDADSGLYATDFRATERLAQLIIQVAGRAGRAELPGEVLIQTHHPDHPILNALARYDLKAVARQLMDDRRVINLPPFSNAVMLRADSPKSGEAMSFLQSIRAFIQPGDGIELWGPVIAPMERRAGRYRSQMMIVASERKLLHRNLTAWLDQIDALKKPSNLRWSVDVDVQDMM